MTGRYAANVGVSLALMRGNPGGLHPKVSSCNPPPHHLKNRMSDSQQYVLFNPLSVHQGERDRRCFIGEKESTIYNHQFSDRKTRISLQYFSLGVGLVVTFL